MDIAIIYTRALIGIDSPLVTIEVHLSRGLPGLSIVGLPEAAVKESKDRVRSAILNNRFEFPLSRITVNLAPADLPKAGGRYDLPIAIGILVASGQIPANGVDRYEFVGELALTGALRPIRGCLPTASACGRAGRALILPAANADEAALIRALDSYPAAQLNDVCAHLAGQKPLALYQRKPQRHEQYYPDLSEVRSQHQAKRALEIAASGGHNLLMTGPPGTGKTMLAERMPGILPPLDEDQALEVAAVNSVSQQGFEVSSWGQRPFRAPHHTASAVAMVGGGSHPRPGEISLAHHGVLFLDELPEYDKRVLEVLRQPLESGVINISRAAMQQQFPARFQLVAAMNPCPCGYHGDSKRQCVCSPQQIRRYRNRLSGPLLDRIDIQIEVPNLAYEVFSSPAKAATETSSMVRDRVRQSMDRQQQRAGKLNSKLGSSELERYCQLDLTQKRLLATAIERFNLSARSLHRLLKLARTIADMDARARITGEDLVEAMAYRGLEHPH